MKSSAYRVPSLSNRCNTADLPSRSWGWNFSLATTCQSLVTHEAGHDPHASGPGGARRNRTDDLLRAKQPLSQLSYNPIVWWNQRGSNSRPPACHAGTLPTELWPQSHRLRRCCVVLARFQGSGHAWRQSRSSVSRSVNGCIACLDRSGCVAGSRWSRTSCPEGCGLQPHGQPPSPYLHFPLLLWRSAPESNRAASGLQSAA